MHAIQQEWTKNRPLQARIDGQQRPIFIQKSAVILVAND
jgi:hypothetical protein